MNAPVSTRPGWIESEGPPHTSTTDTIRPHPTKNPETTLRAQVGTMTPPTSTKVTVVGIRHRPLVLETSTKPGTDVVGYRRQRRPTPQSGAPCTFTRRRSDDPRHSSNGYRTRSKDHRRRSEPPPTLVPYIHPEVSTLLRPRQTGGPSYVGPSPILELCHGTTSTNPEFPHTLGRNRGRDLVIETC